MYERQKAKLKELLKADNWDKAAILKECKCWIAGGAILSLFTGNEVNDIDVFFRSKEDVFNAINSFSAHWYFTKWSATSKGIFKKPVQFVYKNTFSSVEEIFKDFDFSVCCAAYDCATEEFVFGNTFFEDVAARTIHFNPHTNSAIMTIPRIIKYQERGYSFPKTELMKVGLSLANYNLQSWDDVANVLSGTYGSSFSNLAENMKERGVQFSFDEAIDLIAECEDVKNEDSIKNECYISAGSSADTIRKYLNLPLKYFVHNNIPYDTNFCKLTSVPDGSTRIELVSLIKLPLTLYKSIELNRRSTFDPVFEYKEGEYAIANDDMAYKHVSSGAGLYFKRYANEVNCDNKALVTAKVYNYDDINIETLGARNPHIVCKRAFIERITTDADEIELLKQDERKKNPNEIPF